MEITVNYDSTNATLFFTATQNKLFVCSEVKLLLSSKVFSDPAVDDHYHETSLCRFRFGL